MWGPSCRRHIDIFMTSFIKKPKRAGGKLFECSVLKKCFKDSHGYVFWKKFACGACWRMAFLLRKKFARGAIIIVSCACECMHVCMQVCMHFCMYSMYVYICMYVCLYMYVYMYVYYALSFHLWVLTAPEASYVSFASIQKQFPCCTEDDEYF